VKPWFVVARREFLERVRTKWFLIGTLLGPVGMVALIVIPALLARAGATDVRVRVVDHTGQIGETLVSAFARLGWHAEQAAPTTAESELLDQIRAQRINGFLTIPPDGMTAPIVVYKGDNGTNQVLVKTMEVIVNQVVQKRRGASAGLDEQQLTQILRPIGVLSEHTTGETKGSQGAATFIIGYFVMFILCMAILLYAINVMRSVVEEKTSRVVELMVAAIKPRSLMLGKIIGVGSVGLVQLGVWLTMAVLTLKYRDALLGAVGVKGGGGFSVPPLRPQEIFVILVYFVLGYFFYAAVFASVGAMVSSDQEAQQAQTVVTLPLMVMMACVQVVANDPRGAATEVLTQLPLSSAILMPMRYLLGGAGTEHVAISLLILVVSTALVTIAAGRVYRVGILMVGKRPSLRELVRWIRYR
jgi:ABC-2 type transport system permease protein